jgi:hypothetical protein
MMSSGLFEVSKRIKVKMLFLVKHQTSTVIEKSHEIVFRNKYDILLDISDIIESDAGA